MQSSALNIGRRWANVTLAEVGWLFFCGLLFWASKWTGKLFEGTPGHAGAFWIPTLFLARAMVARPGASAMTALMGAAFWCLPRGTPGGLAPYVAAGVALDLLFRDTVALRRLPLALAAGVLCHLAKFGAHNVPAALLGLQGHFFAWGLATVAALHVLFGAVGGFVGWLVLTRLSRQRGLPADHRERT